MKRLMLIAAVLTAAAAGGCVRKRPDPALFIKPTIAVMKFENRAPFPLNWSLGDGMAEILVDRLMATKRYHVVERPELGSVLRELGLQHSGATREQMRAALGRIKNVEYLIKGTVTDFGHVASQRGFFRGGSLRLSGSHARAVMGMTFYVVHVQSGEIVASDSLEKSVHASNTAVAGQYKGVAMGGSVFYQTPLGEATASVMDRAVKAITKAIASKLWRPKIAGSAEGGIVILTGGRDRKISVGWQYDVLETGAAVIDPDTGDLLGRRAPKVIGRLQVVKVQKRYCDTKVLAGEAARFKVRMTCRRFVPKPKPKPTGKAAPKKPGSRSRAKRPS